MKPNRLSLWLRRDEENPLFPKKYALFGDKFCSKFNCYKHNCTDSFKFHLLIEHKPSFDLNLVCGLFIYYYGFLLIIDMGNNNDMWFNGKPTFVFVLRLLSTAYDTIESPRFTDNAFRSFHIFLIYNSNMTHIS